MAVGFIERISMKKFEKKEIYKKSKDISRWYTDVVLKSELADYGPARGTMVIRPYGFAIWERVQEIFNKMMKDYGVENAYFPLFIPYSLLEKEKEHVKGFSPELAVVTHGGGKKLKEPLVVRPTSETIMYEMYSKWIHSWRDLPVLINQWNNVVRWEMRTYLFLRTTEFLWQEGHTAHKTEEKAMEMVLKALNWYREIYEKYFAMPVLYGAKSEAERFAGAKATYAIEALMPDGKALQVATSHNLGQNFSKVFDISFQDKNGKNQYVWQTSWGLTTRALGGLFLVHGDDNGLVLPPKIAPIQVVIVPIYKDANKKRVLKYAEKIEEKLQSELRVKLDKREEYTPGYKFNEWELKGVPLRLEIGEKELVESKVKAVKRVDMVGQIVLGIDDLVTQVRKLLDGIQISLFKRAEKFLKENTYKTDSYDEFKKIMGTKKGFIKALWCGNPDCETKIKEETKATTRALPFDERDKKGKCIYCKKEAIGQWIFAQAY